MGGSMSPSQEHRASPNVPGRELHREQSRGSLISSGGGVTQILPLRLSEGEGKASLDSRVSRSSGGYQRLHSPPPPTTTPGDSAHHRTGSSPATLQNGGGASPSAGSPSPLQTVAAGILGVGHISSSIGSAGQRAARTNTYPKLAIKPAVNSSATGSSRTTVTSSVPHVQLQQQQQLLQQQLQQEAFQQQQQALHQQQQSQNSSNTRPGQRIKDPDTNEDIIFF